MEVVQKLPAVEAFGALDLPLGARRFERGHVAGDDVGVEPDMLRADDCVLTAKIAAEHAEGLTQLVARAILIGIRVEDCRERVTRYPTLTGAREHRQQGQWSERRARPVYRMPIAGHREATEHREVEHR